jgi:hypothetical protein
MRSILALAALAASPSASTRRPPRRRARRAQSRRRAKAQDPYSAKFEAIRARTVPNLKGRPTRVICGTVNAKNAFGGYVGAQPFVYFVEDHDFNIESRRRRRRHAAGHAQDVLQLNPADDSRRLLCDRSTSPIIIPRPLA